MTCVRSLEGILERLREPWLADPSGILHEEYTGSCMLSFE